MATDEARQHGCAGYGYKKKEEEEEGEVAVVAVAVEREAAAVMSEAWWRREVHLPARHSLGCALDALATVFVAVLCVCRERACME